MDNLIIDALTKRRRGYIRHGVVKVLPVRRTVDWLPENSDSAFMNTGSKVEYVVPRMQRSGLLVDPLADLSSQEKDKVAKELGFEDGSKLNIMLEQKKNFWINRTVVLDKNGRHFDLANVADFISYKILEVNADYIAPSWEERYNKGTYKFSLVFEDEEAKIKNLKIDTKKEAYMLFGKMDGSVKKLSDFLWIYYLTNKDGKRLPNNPTLDYLKSETGRIIEERPGEFLSIVTDPNFETKSLIQKSINIGLIQKDGSNYRIFGEEKAINSLDGLINYLLDDRNNNIRLSLLGKTEDTITPEPLVTKDKSVSSLESRLEEIEKSTKKFEQENQDLREQNQKLLRELEEARASIPSASPVKGKGKRKTEG